MSSGIGRGLSGRGALLLKAMEEKSRRPGEEEEEKPAPPPSAQPGRGGRGAILMKLMQEQRKEVVAPIKESPVSLGRGVRVGALSASPSSSKDEGEREVQLRSKPTKTVFPKGVEGEKILLEVNYIHVKFESGRGVYEYAVHFKPDVDSRNIRFNLIKQRQDILGEVRVFDGAKLYLPFKLEEHVTILCASHPGTQDDIQISVKFVDQNSIEDCVHLFNVIFKKVMGALKLIQFGANTGRYDPRCAIRIPQHRLEIWPGFITSVHEYSGGLLLMADCSYRVLRRDTVMDILRDVQKTQRGNFKDNALKQLLGLVVLTRYNNRTYRIEDIAWGQNPRCSFSTERGEELTYVNYYRQQYQIDIKDHNQPLIVSKLKRGKREKGKEAMQVREVMLVPELCYLTGLTDDLRSNFKIMKDIGVHTRAVPNDRQATLRKFIGNIKENPDAKKHLDNWGIKINESPIQLDGRELKKEKIILHDECTLTSDRADWSNFVCNKKVIKAVNLDNWVIIVTQKDGNKARDFLEEMCKVCPAFGMQVSRPKIYYITDERTDTIVRSLQENITKQLQMVVVIYFSKRDDIYSCIKKTTCCDKPVPSQVINVKTLSRPDKLRSIVSKIALQINCKLGGELWALEIPLKHIMICGFDVYHDPKRGKLSVLGFVSSLNPAITRWFNHTVMQTPGQEIGDCLKICLVMGLRKYNDINNRLPERIIVYRDGVSDGQLRTVKEYEVYQMEQAFASFGAHYKPKFTVIIVQKKINTRIVKAKIQEDVNKVKKVNYLNPAPGTVLDHGITNLFWYDFYLVSQHVNQGTVAPTHYIVLCDGNNLKPDQVQRFTYKMTHLYYNWPGTIRVPAMCLYAHRLAFLVGQHIHMEPSSDLCVLQYYL